MQLPAFDNADVKSFEEFAVAVRDRRTPNAECPKELSVGGITVPTRTVPPRGQNTALVSDDDLRAEYSWNSKQILSRCLGIEIPKTERAIDHIVCVVGHEALHAIQADHFSENQLAKAIELNKKAAAEPSDPEAYADYISCAVELPAHAVMIALELRRTDPSNFNEAAFDTHINRYFTKRLKGAVLYA